jgi:hypothetical protein
MEMVQYWVQEIKHYRSDQGIIVQRDGDQGDSLNRIGVYYSALAALNVTFDDLLTSPSAGLAWTEYRLSQGLKFGRFRRGNAKQINGKDRWFNNPDNVTRDQMVTFEAALALNNQISIARAHFWQRAKRLFFHFSTQNDGADAGPVKHKLPDICTPSEFGTLVRATKYKSLYWILPLTDLFLYIDVAFSRSLSERSLYDADNQLLPQVLAALNEPTFVTEFIRRKYATTDAAARLRAYYSEQLEADGMTHKNGIEPLGELAVLAFERAIGGFTSEKLK